jgi:CRP-like cAMP-binding protein
VAQVPYNRLLRALSDEDRAQLEPHLRPIWMQRRQVLIPPHQPIAQVFFPLSGLASVTNAGSNDKVEMGLIGYEGLVGVSVLLGSDRSPLDHFCQGAGEALAVDTGVFCAAVERSEPMRKLFLRFVETFLIQTAQTALTNAAYGIDARLARWLLMSQDRMGGDSIALTQEFLSVMLGVQRTSVTLSLQALVRNGLIRAQRGRIGIRSRDGLKEMAGASYGVPEAEYRRLIGEL